MKRHKNLGITSKILPDIQYPDWDGWCISECPLDLREAISSLIYAAPRCADVEELSQVRAILAAKYGKEFVAAAAELRPDCGVSRNVSTFTPF